MKYISSFTPSGTHIGDLNICVKSYTFIDFVTLVIL